MHDGRSAAHPIRRNAPADVYILHRPCRTRSVRYSRYAVNLSLPYAVAEHFQAFADLARVMLCYRR